MALMMSVSAAVQIEEGVWRVSLPPADVKHLGVGHTTTGSVSILGAHSPEYDSQSRILLMRPTDVDVFNVGDTDRALVIDLGDRSPHPDAATKPSIAEGFRSSRGGDEAFVEECRRHLSDRLVRMAQQLLRQVRLQFPGELREGQARKWVNSPNNFLAMTIQNRDQSFAIYIRGRPQDFSVRTLDIRDDRPGYCRFKLQRQDQLDEAIDVILTSAQDR